MNLNRSIQILLSSTVIGERGVSIALYELRERGNRLHLCGIANDQPSTEWARELVMPSLDAGHILSPYPDKDRVTVYPIEAQGALQGLLCIRPNGVDPITKQQLARTAQTCDSLASLLALARKIRSYDNLVSEISALHLELADQKISDRARGLLDDEESPDAITAHVNRVSESIKFVDELHATIDDVRSQLNARQLLHRAKEKLQKDQGISEEEAYLTLRHMSRRTRTPLGAIAKLVLGQDPIPATMQ